MDESDDKTLTAKEVCRIFDIGEKRLQELRELGLPFIELKSGRRKYLRPDVREFLRGLRKTEN